jgi:glycosyltransferase involved in cell wall biosynthesis
VALEAAAGGRPVIAAQSAGLQEIIDDGRTGLLAPPHDPRALADALALLLASPALCREMAARARRRAETHFTLARHLDTLLALLGLATAAAPPAAVVASALP